MSFEALRGELDQLAKALPTTVAPVAAAAGSAAGEQLGEGEGEVEILGKSFSFQLGDGTTIEAVDGTDLVKSFGARLVANEESHAADMAEVLGVVTQQTALIKSLQEQVVRLGGTGAGRRSVLSVTESVTRSNSEQPMAKAHGFTTGQQALDAAEVAFKAERINSTELAKCEGYIGRGLPFPADLLAKVQGPASA
jgi:hypothetical protein